MKNILFAIFILLISMPARAEDSVRVTPDNFVRAESDMYFGNIIKDAGGIGKITHHREPIAIDKQLIVRPNRDTLYSSAVFDLEAGPVTVTMPEAGDRFMSLLAIDEDHYVHDIAYGAGSHTYTKNEMGTRYAVVIVRTLVDPNDPADLKKVHDLQDAIKIEQSAGAGNFEIPKWDPVSQKKVRDALLQLGETLPDSRNACGAKDQIDPIRHVIVTAVGWGCNPDKDALYENVTPDKNDGKTIYKLTAKDVPVDGFWSITVYNAKGYMEKNKYNAYSLNNITAKKDADGAVTVQFGGCNGKIPNCLPIMKGWNYIARLYRPRDEILNGSWKFPKPEEVK